MANKRAPYTVKELQRTAEQCTDRDGAARKVERKMRKVVAALLLQQKIGQECKTIVTGITPKGTFACIIKLPADGRVMRRESGLRN